MLTEAARRSRGVAGVASPRVAMTVSISDDAHDAWRTFASQHGITMTALAEVLGHHFETLDPHRLPRDLAARVEEARAYDAEQRSRQRDPYA